MQLARLAERAAEVLPNLPLAQQREVLSILRVRVVALDSTGRPALRIEGVVPGGDNLFGDASSSPHTPVTPTA